MGKTREEIAKRRIAAAAVKKLRREYNNLETYSHDTIADIHFRMQEKKTAAAKQMKIEESKRINSKSAKTLSAEIREYEVLIQQLGQLNYHLYNVKKMNKELTGSLKKTRKQADHFRSEMTNYDEISKVFKSSEIASQDNRIFRKALKVKSML